MKTLRSLLLFTPMLLASCGGPTADDYFQSYGKAGESVKDRKSLAISSKNTVVDIGFVDADGKTLRVTSKPMSFVLASDTVAAEDVDHAGIALTMAKPTNELNSVSVTGTMLEKSGFGGFSSASLKVSINAYLKDGGIYVDMTNSAILRAAINTLLAQTYENAPTLFAKDKLLVDTSRKDELNANLPLTQYVNDSVADQVKAFQDMYAANQEAFTFSEADGKKTISLSTSNKEDAKKLYTSIAPDSELDIDKYLSYCSSLSFSLSSTFTEAGVERLSLAMALDGFDQEKIKADNPDLKMFPVGPFKISSTLDFAYDEDAKVAYPSFSDYREVDLTNLKKKENA